MFINSIFRESLITEDISLGEQLPSPPPVTKLGTGLGTFAALSPELHLLMFIAMIKVTMDSNLTNFCLLVSFE